MNFFCHLPWTAVQIDQHRFMPCCAFMPSGQSKVETLSEYFDSEELEQVKSQLLSGQAPKQCKNCVINEQKTGHSFRLLHNKFHDEKTQKVMENPSTRSIPIELNVLTSNTCNLLCLPCNGSSSYVRGIELNKIGLAHNIPIHFKKNKILDEVHNFDFESITFLGGEPFGDKVTFECLEKLVETEKSKNITLDLNTNGTLIDQKKLEFLSEHFKFVYIKASIDGIGAVNDYLRYPSTWQDLQSRVLLAQNYSNMNLMITTALSNLGLMRYYQLIEWAITNSIKDLFLTTVRFPGVLEVGNLPVEIKKQLLEIYQNLKTRYQYQMTERIEYVIDTCINICQSDIQRDFSQTMTWLQKHDQHRKTNVLQIFPELEPYAQAQ